MGGKARTLFQAVLWGAALWASGGGAVAFAPYLQGVAVAYGAWAARDAAKRNRSALNAALQDRQIIIRSASAAKNYIYGRAYVSGVLAYHRSPKSKADPWFWMVLALPIAHKIHDITQIYFGDQDIGPLDTNGYVTGGAFRKTITNTQIFSGNIPAGNVVTVTGNPEDQSEDFTVQPGMTCAVKPVSSGTEWDIDFVPVTASITGPRTVRIPGNTGDAFTLTVSYTFTRPYMQVWRYTGDPDQVANQSLIDATVSESDRWTASDRLRGVPYIIMRMRVDPDVYPRDMEAVSMLVWGKADILDTRLGASSYSVNPILCARDYAVRCCGILAGEFSLAGNVNAEANVCDELVPTSNSETQARYALNVTLSTEAPPIDNLATILSACDGNGTYSGSTFDLYAGHYIEPTVAFDDSDLAGPPEVIKSPDRMELVNGVKVRFLDAAQPFWPLTDAPAYLSPFYAEQDGGLERVFEIELAGTADSRMAQRIGKQMLHRARAGLRVRANFNIKAFQVSPEQTIWLSLRSLGFDEKVFRIKAIKPTSPVTVELLLQEDSSVLYAWNFDEATYGDPAPNTNLQSVRIVQEIQGLGADTSVNAAASGPSGELVSQCKVFWQPIYDPLVLARGKVQARHKRAQDSAFTNAPDMPPTATEFRFPCKRGDVLTIQVRAANSLVAGAWKTLVKVADDSPTQYLTGNLLRNAELVSDDPTIGYIEVPGWDEPQGINTSATPGFFRQGGGSERAGWITWRQNGAEVGQISYTMNSDYISVIPGDRMLVFGLVNSLVYSAADRKSDVWMGVNFYTSGEVFTEQHFTNRVRTTEPATSGLQTFRMVEKFVTVPSTSSLARVFVMMEGINNGDNNDPIEAVFSRPFFGRASAGQVTRPPWSA